MSHLFGNESSKVGTGHTDLDFLWKNLPENSGRRQTKANEKSRGLTKTALTSLMNEMIIDAPS